MLERMRSKQPGASLRSILFYRLVAAIARWGMKIGWGLTPIHVERVPVSGPLILVANHQSYLDPPAIGCLIPGRNLDYIARVGLFTFKPLGWFIGALNSIPIRGTGGADAGTIREVVARLNMGRATLMFPEGSRTSDGRLQDFQAGVMLLVRKAKCPVQPVAIVGAYRAWPRSRGLPTPWTSRVRVMYGEPIPAETLLALPTDGAVALLRERIAGMLRELGEPVDAAPLAAAQAAQP
jgi:1-acyl-sn-glycerol-3-phosphate acyltransferase